MLDSDRSGAGHLRARKWPGAFLSGRGTAAGVIAGGQSYRRADLTSERRQTKTSGREVAARETRQNIAFPTITARITTPIASTRNTKNKIFAMLAAPAATPVNPKNPATIEIRKNMSAHLSMGRSPYAGAT